MSGIRDWVIDLILERPVRNIPSAEMAKQLQSSGEQFMTKLAACPDTAQNRTRLSHLIGIERWGQQRLKVALGRETFVQDEYDGYRPAETLGWEELKEGFRETRRETVVLAVDVQAHDKQDQKVAHNMFGEISTRAWLKYLMRHARLEGKGIK